MHRYAVRQIEEIARRLHAWELRPDEASVKARTQFWDLLRSGGVVLRDPSGPRSLIMGRPHSRVAEGLELRFALEPLGADAANPEGVPVAESPRLEEVLDGRGIRTISRTGRRDEAGR